jgi:valyl-tRNA synthetase
MDTWATSSLSPQIATGWEEDDDLFRRTFPMDLRPQGPEIIRTWLFATVLRSHLEHGTLPWSHATINGWILDPDRKKMSKSRGNVVTPMPLLEEYGADAVRYWADSGRPGTDTAVDFGQMRVGRRLAIKILNASRFALGLGEPPPGATATEALDRAMLGKLAEVVDGATAAFERFDYARALEVVEPFFWHFCDDYLELVKGRAYGGQGDEAAASATAALRTALSTLLRLFAPFLPFVTEEVWSWWREGSVHRASWPERAELGDVTGPEVLDVAAEVLAAVRRAKTEAKVSMRAPVERVVVGDTAERIAALELARGDLIDAGKIESLETQPADALSVEAELASAEDRSG